jgi:hypothetical protein
MGMAFPINGHKQRFHLLVLALLAIEESEIVERYRDIGVLRLQHLLSNRQRALVERFRLLVLVQVKVEYGEVADTLITIEMVSRAQKNLFDPVAILLKVHELSIPRLEAVVVRVVVAVKARETANRSFEMTAKSRMKGEELDDERRQRPPIVRSPF